MTWEVNANQPGSSGLVQGVDTDDHSLDETVAIGDRDVVPVPRGYPPARAALGNDLHDLNIVAGPVRTWRRIHNEPAHAGQ